MQLEKKQTITHISILVLLSLFVAFVWFGTIDWQGSYSHVDLGKYRQMASAAPGIATGVAPPFAYRILAPWLAGVFFSDSTTGFRVLTVAAMVLFTILSYFWLQQHSVSKTTAFYLAVCICFNPFVSGLVYFDYFQLCDALTYLWLTILLFSINKSITNSKLVLFSLVFAVATLTRETALLLVPIILLAGIRKRSWQLLLRILVAITPGVAVWYFIRTGVITSTHEFWSLQQALHEYLPKALAVETWYRILINTFVPFSLIPIIAYKQTFKILREHPEYAVFILGILGSVFLGADTERLVAPAWIVVSVLVGTAIDNCASRKTHLYIRMILLSILSSMHFLVSNIHPFSKVQYYALCGFCCIVFAVILLRDNNTIKSISHQRTLS